MFLLRHLNLLEIKTDYVGMGDCPHPLPQGDDYMADIIFNPEKLNKEDRKIFDMMTDSEKQNFERTWLMIETQKEKLRQQKTRSRERNRREQKEIAIRQRKERTHRLIERGALLESFVDGAEVCSNDVIKNLLIDLFNTSEAEAILKKYCPVNTHNTSDADSNLIEDDCNIY